MKTIQLKRLLTVFKRTLSPGFSLLSNIQIKDNWLTYTNGHYLVSVGTDAKPGLYSVPDVLAKIKADPGDRAAHCFDGVEEQHGKYPNWESAIPDYTPGNPHTTKIVLRVDYLLDILSAAKISGVQYLELTTQGPPTGNGHSAQVLLVKAHPERQNPKPAEFTAILAPVEVKSCKQV